MIPYLYIRIEGDCSDGAVDKPFSPNNTAPLTPISGTASPSTTPLEITGLDEIVGLLEEIVDTEGVLVIDGVRFWAKSKVVDL